MLCQIQWIQFHKRENAIRSFCLLLFSNKEKSYKKWTPRKSAKGAFKFTISFESKFEKLKTKIFGAERSWSNDQVIRIFRSQYFPTFSPSCLMTSNNKNNKYLNIFIWNIERFWSYDHMNSYEFYILNLCW